MKKIIITVFFILVNIFFAGPAAGQEIAGHSAKITYNLKEADSAYQDFIIKKLVVIRILKKYQSPLTDEADSFIEYCRQFELDCYLLPSITGLESYFGRYIHPYSFNPFGWGGGYIMFRSWDEAIRTVAKGLRENYVDRGADTVEKIAPIYAESKTWAVRVTAFKKMFEKEEEKISLILKHNEVKL